jgi:predicted dienelactone hydrolase
MVYAFFEPRPTVHEDKDRRWVQFKCTARHCESNSRIIKRFLDTKDSSSTANLQKHAKACWGEEVVLQAEAAKTVDAAQEGLAKAEMRDGRITAVFERQGKGPITFSTIPHTYEETR